VANTFIATLEAIRQVGARPILVDMDPATCTIAVDQVAARITSRTRAVVPVHLYGRLADMDLLVKLARAHGLRVIEDASQAHGATDAAGRRAGSFGDLGCFSFYYAKNLGAYGEAGAITTSDPKLDRQLRLLRSHGEDVRYHHAIDGYNARPDELQSAMLRVKLPHLERWNELRRGVAAEYHRLLADLPFERPELIGSGEHVYHQYVIRSLERDPVRAQLTEMGIGTGIHYPIPVHLQEAYRDLGYRAGEFPHSERAAREVLSLPLYPEMTNVQVETVAAAIHSCAAREVA